MLAETPLDLMRSRYSAYALGLADYIIATTDKKGPQYNFQKKLWKKQIAAFCRENTFDALTIVSENDDTIEFIATLSTGMIHETSTFTNKNGKWLYYSGTLAVN